MSLNFDDEKDFITGQPIRCYYPQGPLRNTQIWRIVAFTGDIHKPSAPRLEIHGSEATQELIAAEAKELAKILMAAAAWLEDQEMEV